MNKFDKSIKICCKNSSSVDNLLIDEGFLDSLKGVFQNVTGRATYTSHALKGNTPYVMRNVYYLKKPQNINLPELEKRLKIDEIRKTEMSPTPVAANVKPKAAGVPNTP